MSREDNHQRDGESHERLEKLWRSFESGEEAPGFERLLSLINAPHNEPAQGKGHEDSDMLAVMIGEAMNGVDIAARYPRFFRRLLVDAELRAAFLDGLQALEEGRLPVADVLPRAPNRDLSFLKRAPAVGAATGAASDYLARWTRAAHDLVSLLSFVLPSPLNPFTMGEPAPVYRSEDDSLQDVAVTLLQGRVAGNGVEVNVTLEGARTAAQPDELQLTLWVLTVYEERQFPADLALVARIDWGDYRQEVEIGAEGSYPLPPRNVEQLANQVEDIGEELAITIHRKP